jgi:very-short-patch-repair endonuclease
MLDLNSAAGYQYLYEEYIQKQKSTCEIAEELGTYPNKIRRTLLYHKIPLRDSKKALKIALQKGRHPHPTKGTTRPQDVKNRIGEGRSDTWKTVSPKERERLSKIGKDNWEKRPEKERHKMHELAQEKLREAAKQGSKLEKYLLLVLQKAGHNANLHGKYFIVCEKMHLDIVLTDKKVAVEIDGPTHFSAIFGDEYELERVQEADRRKNNLLLQSGFSVVRVKNLAKNISEVQMRRTGEKLLSLVESIKGKPDIYHLEVD